MGACGGDDMGRWSPADPKSNSVTTALSVCLPDALRATDANMEMRLLIASVACKLLIYGHLRVTLGLPGKSIAQSAKRLASIYALLYWFPQKQLNFASSWSFKLRTDHHLCNAFGFICVVIGREFDAVRN